MMIYLPEKVIFTEAARPRGISGRYIFMSTEIEVNIINCLLIYNFPSVNENHLLSLKLDLFY